MTDGMDEKEIEQAFDEKYLESILQRNPHLLTHLKIHPLRWRMLTVWVLTFTVLVFWGIRLNRIQISQLNQTKASLAALQKTNCALRAFLYKAYAVRIKTANDRRADPQARAAARSAAQGYHRLYILFPPDNCKSTLQRGSSIPH